MPQPSRRWPALTPLLAALLCAGCLAERSSQQTLELLPATHTSDAADVVAADASDGLASGDAAETADTADAADASVPDTAIADAADAADTAVADAADDAGAVTADAADDADDADDADAADTDAADTAVADTAVADTAVTDTAVTDTAVTDTAVTDAAADTIAADTAVTDAAADTDTAPAPTLGWPFGAEGDLVVAVNQTVQLDSDARDPAIWDFASCTVAGTLEIIGSKPWIIVGCAKGAKVDGSVVVKAGYDLADYSDSAEPDAKGQLLGAPLQRLPFSQSLGGGGSSTGNGHGGAAGGVCSYCDKDKACNPPWTSGTGGEPTLTTGGEGAGEPAKKVGGKGGTAAAPKGEDGGFYESTTLGVCVGNTGGGGGFRGSNTSNLLLRVRGGLSGGGTMVLDGAPGAAGGNGGPGGICTGKCGYNGNNTLVYLTSNAVGGGGGGGGAGGKLVLRLSGGAPWPSAQVSAVGGAGGAGGKPGSSPSYAAPASKDGAAGAAGGVDIKVVEP